MKTIDLMDGRTIDCKKWSVFEGLLLYSITGEEESGDAFPYMIKLSDVKAIRPAKS